MSEATPTLLETLIEKRSAMADEAQAILDSAAAEARDLTEVEEARASELHEEMSSASKEIELRESIARSRFAAEKASRSVEVKSEPLTYDRSYRHSYFKDLASSRGIFGGIDAEADARLQRHAKEMDVELTKRVASRTAKAESEMRSLGAGELNAFERRAGNTTVGTGGTFVPPIYMIDDWIAFLRFGRPFVNSLRNVPLPAGTDSINIPKLTTGTLTGAQTANNAALSNRDIADTYVTAPVQTLGGYVDISLQLLEQSPNQIIDEILMQDMAADLALQIDNAALNGTGSSGQITGLLNVSGINTVTYTDASPTQAKLWSPLAQGLSQLVQNRKVGDGVTCFMHPRRYYYLASGLDSSNRPLIVPSSMGAYNPQATNGAPVAEGYVANLVLGVPVVLDGSIPTTVGAGTNQDTIIFSRGDDSIFFESEPRFDVFKEVLASTAAVRFRAYEYVALAARYATAITAINGTGLVAPSGF